MENSEGLGLGQPCPGSSSSGLICPRLSAQTRTMRPEPEIYEPALLRHFNIPCKLPEAAIVIYLPSAFNN